MHSDSTWAAFIHRFRLTALLVLAIVGTARGQQVAVSGVVIERSRSAPIMGARVSLAGLPIVTTDSAGRFRFAHVARGSYVLIVGAIGYQPRTVDLTVTADTALRIEMEALTTNLAPMIVRAGRVTVKGSIRDAATRQKLLWASAILYPGSRAVGALSGDFRFDSVPRGQAVTVAVEAMEHLPAQITFIPGRDTSVRIDLRIDSVGIRMIAQQAQRLAKRSRGIPISLLAFDRRELELYSGFTVAQLLSQHLPHGVIKDDVGGTHLPCVFYDDQQSTFPRIAVLPAEVVDRIEV